MEPHEALALVGGAALLWVTLYVLVAPLLPRARPEDSKRRAWVLSFANAVASVALSLPAAGRALAGGWRGGLWPVSVFLETPPGSPWGEGSGAATAGVVLFAGFCVADIAVGLVDYRERITFLTGWVHHLLYAGILARILLRHECTPFSCFLLEEVPTVVLAFGGMTGSRYDLTFGLTFLATRILFHSWGLASAHAWRGLYTASEHIWFIWLSLALHVFWFRGWIVSYSKHLKKRKAS